MYTVYMYRFETGWNHAQEMRRSKSYGQRQRIQIGPVWCELWSFSETAFYSDCIFRWVYPPPKVYSPTQVFNLCIGFLLRGTSGKILYAQLLTCVYVVCIKDDSETYVNRCKQLNVNNEQWEFTIEQF